MCIKYINDKYYEFMINILISLWIVSFNKFLEIVILKLSTKIGFESFSKLKVFMTNSIFIAEFIDTAFVLLIINANLKEHFPYILSKYT